MYGQGASRRWYSTVGYAVLQLKIVECQRDSRESVKASKVP